MEKLLLVSALAEPDGLAPEPPYDPVADPEVPEEAAEEDEELVEDEVEVTSEVVKLKPGILIVPTSQVLPSSLVVMVASTSVPRPRVSM